MDGRMEKCKIKNKNVSSISNLITMKMKSSFKILNIPGGSVRGLLALTVLIETQKYIRLHGQDKNYNLCEQFDMFSGVSVGALITMMLGVLRYSVDEVEAVVTTELIQNIFKKSSIDELFHECQFKPVYDGRAKTKFLQSIFKDRTFCRQHVTQPLVLVSGYNLKTQRVQYFDNVKIATSPEDPHFLHVASLSDCLSSPPIYFPILTLPYHQVNPEFPSYPLLSSSSPAILTRKKTCGWLSCCCPNEVAEVDNENKVEDNGDVDKDNKMENNGDVENKQGVDKDSKMGNNGNVDNKVGVTDSGLQNNDNSISAIVLANNYLKVNNMDMKIKVLSLGTGYSDKPLGDECTDWGAIQWFKDGNLLDILMGDTSVEQIAVQMLPQGDFVCVNGPLPRNISSSFDDATDTNLEGLRCLGRSWFQSYRVQILQFFDWQQSKQ
jgi:hypothetical protein